VLAASAFIMTIATETKTDTTGHTFTTLTNPGYVKASFWVLLVLSSALFAVGRWGATKATGGSRFDAKWDLLRLCIPALAYWGWTMLATNTPFNAVASWPKTGREIVAVLLAVGLAPIAALFSINAQKQEPKPPPSAA
jgi:hypothetical protein